MEIIWLHRALKDLAEIRHHSAKDNPTAATRVSARLFSGMSILEAHLHIGRLGRVSNTREFIFSDVPYVGIYRIVTDDPPAIEILNILHTARLYPPNAEE